MLASYFQLKKDISNCVEIWRSEHAHRILNILSKVFTDIDSSELDVDLDSDEDLDDVVDPEWINIRR